jgi:hypothetical protein
MTALTIRCRRARKGDPDTVSSAWASRAFLPWAVRYPVGKAGIRQFPDIRTGIPTASNTHQVAQSVTPECRVVYVVTTRFCKTVGFAKPGSILDLWR